MEAVVIVVALAFLVGLGWLTVWIATTLSKRGIENSREWFARSGRESNDLE